MVLLQTLETLKAQAPDLNIPGWFLTVFGILSLGFGWFLREMYLTARQQRLDIQRIDQNDKQMADDIVELKGFGNDRLQAAIGQTLFNKGHAARQKRGILGKFKQGIAAQRQPFAQCRK